MPSPTADTTLYVYVLTKFWAYSGAASQVRPVRPRSCLVLQNRTRWWQQQQRGARHWYGGLICLRQRWRRRPWYSKDFKYPLKWTFCSFEDKYSIEIALTDMVIKIACFVSCYYTNYYFPWYSLITVLYIPFSVEIQAKIACFKYNERLHIKTWKKLC